MFFLRQNSVSLLKPRLSKRFADVEFNICSITAFSSLLASIALCEY